jgi:DNA polymerase I-like protein with 3'-5' exonuclease and polymerase domains
MIYFITNSKIHQVTSIPDKLAVLDIDAGESRIINYAKHILETDSAPRVAPIDTETTGLNPHKDKILLTIIGTIYGDEYVIDTATENGRKLVARVIELFNDMKMLFIGANLKYDWKMMKGDLGLTLINTYDTEITERRLYQGLGVSKDNPGGMKFGLFDVLMRRFGKVPDAMDKDVRYEFVGARLSTFVFKNYHIQYAAGDVSQLIPLWKLQLVDVQRNRQELLIHEIEQPLMQVLAKAELKGFRLDVDAWTALYRENRKQAFDYSIQLDTELRRLVAESPPDVQQKFTGGRLYYKRTPQELDYTGLFGEKLGNKEIIGLKKKNVNLNGACYNYESPIQLQTIFGLLNEPFPTKTGDYIVPKIATKGKALKIVNDYEQFSGIEGNFNNYIIELPSSRMLPFIRLLIEFRFYTTRASNFGMNFIDDFLDKTTGRLHTIFRQAHAITGRLQSGDKDNNLYNAQNVPADKAYRHCFIADEGYSIGTYDLSGAEAVIMCSKAQDPDLKRMAIEEDDIHSPIAQAVWKNIYNYRAGKAIGAWSTPRDYWTLKSSPSIKAAIKGQSRSAGLYRQAVELVITKTVNKQMRTDFKSCTFGAVYGMYAKKAAKTLNVAIDEGQIAIDTIKLMIPKTFAMVEANAKFAVTNGYLILNTRTNSRMYFPYVLNSINNKVPLEFRDKSNAESAARNSPIQGTQADMIKECMVEIDKYIVNNNLGIDLLKSVHDELVYHIPKHMDGHSEEFLSSPDNFNFDAYVKGKMVEVCNRYLTNITMGVSGEVKPYWTK